MERHRRQRSKDTLKPGKRKEPKPKEDQHVLAESHLEDALAQVKVPTSWQRKYTVMFKAPLSYKEVFKRRADKEDQSSDRTRKEERGQRTGTVHTIRRKETFRVHHEGTQASQIASRPRIQRRDPWSLLYWRCTRVQDQQKKGYSEKKRHERFERDGSTNLKQKSMKQKLKIRQRERTSHCTNLKESASNKLFS